MAEQAKQIAELQAKLPGKPAKPYVSVYVPSETTTWELKVNQLIDQRWTTVGWVRSWCVDYSSRQLGRRPQDVEVFCNDSMLSQSSKLELQDLDVWVTPVVMVNGERMEEAVTVEVVDHIEAYLY